MFVASTTFRCLGSDINIAQNGDDDIKKAASVYIQDSFRSQARMNSGQIFMKNYLYQARTLCGD